MKKLYIILLILVIGITKLIGQEVRFVKIDDVNLRQSLASSFGPYSNHKLDDYDVKEYAERAQNYLYGFHGLFGEWEGITTFLDLPEIHVEFGSFTDKVAAARYKNDNTRTTIVVDAGKWVQLSGYDRAWLMFHELAHDVFNLEHGQGGPIMFPIQKRSTTLDELADGVGDLIKHINNKHLDEYNKEGFRINKSTWAYSINGVYGYYVAASSDASRFSHIIDYWDIVTGNPYNLDLKKLHKLIIIDQEEAIKSYYNGNILFCEKNPEDCTRLSYGSNKDETYDEKMIRYNKELKTMKDNLAFFKKQLLKY